MSKAEATLLVLAVVANTLPPLALILPSILIKLASISTLDVLNACETMVSSLLSYSGFTSVTLPFASVTKPLRAPITPPAISAALSCANKRIEPLARTDVVAVKVPD